MVKTITYKLDVDIMGHVSHSYEITADRNSGITAKYVKFGGSGPQGLMVMCIDVDASPDSQGPKEKMYNIKNEDFKILPTEKLFEELDKIKFPEETKFINPNIMDASVWNLIVDGKKYYGTAEPEFFKKVCELLKIKDIRNHIEFK